MDGVAESSDMISFSFGLDWLLCGILSWADLHNATCVVAPI